MPPPLELLRGTLDVLILKAVSREPLHGYGISRWIGSVTRDAFQIEEGALYPALRRLEQRGHLSSQWRQTDTGREARFYTLTADGEDQLVDGMRTWTRYVRAMDQVLHSAGPA